MSYVAGPMYEWSKSLTDERVDEDEAVVIVGSGRSRHEKTSRNCTVRGKRDGTTVVVTYHEYYQASAPTMLGYGAAVPSVLDVFIAHGLMPVECVVRRKKWWERLISKLRGRAVAHPLLESCVLKIAPEGPNRPPLVYAALLDAAAVVLRQPDWMSLEFQSATGLTALRRCDPGAVTPGFLEASVQAASAVEFEVTRERGAGGWNRG